MQTEFSFSQQVKALEAYKPLAVNRRGNKLWFSYKHAVGTLVNAYYDYATRSFKSVVKGSQYGDGVAIRNLVARPVVESVLGK